MREIVKCKPISHFHAVLLQQGNFVQIAGANIATNRLWTIAAFVSLLLFCVRSFKAMNEIQVNVLIL